MPWVVLQVGLLRGNNPDYAGVRVSMWNWPACVGPLCVLRALSRIPTMGLLATAVISSLLPYTGAGSISRPGHRESTSHHGVGCPGVGI